MPPPPEPPRRRRGIWITVAILGSIVLIAATIGAALLIGKPGTNPGTTEASVSLGPTTAESWGTQTSPTEAVRQTCSAFVALNNEATAAATAARTAGTLPAYGRTWGAKWQSFFATGLVPGTPWGIKRAFQTFGASVAEDLAVVERGQVNSVAMEQKYQIQASALFALCSDWSKSLLPKRPSTAAALPTSQPMSMSPTAAMLSSCGTWASAQRTAIEAWNSVPRGAGLSDPARAQAVERFVPGWTQLVAGLRANLPAPSADEFLWAAQTSLALAYQVGSGRDVLYAGSDALTTIENTAGDQVRNRCTAAGAF